MLKNWNAIDMREAIPQSSTDYRLHIAIIQCNHRMCVNGLKSRCHTLDCWIAGPDYSQDCGSQSRGSSDATQAHFVAVFHSRLDIALKKDTAQAQRSYGHRWHRSLQIGSASTPLPCGACSTIRQIPGRNRSSRAPGRAQSRCLETRSECRCRWG